MSFGVTGHRTQMVLIALNRLELQGDVEQWVQIFSPIGPVDEIYLEQALRSVGELTCGSLETLPDNRVHLRHSAPIAGMNTTEERPLRWITVSTDRMEREFGLGGIDSDHNGILACVGP